MIFRTLLVILFYMLGLINMLGQNLVRNPGFEDAIACPQDYGTFENDVIFWHKPTKGSTDYFKACGTKMSTGLNFIGKQETFEGQAYAGFYAYGPKDYREYVGGELIEKLEKGKTYEFSFRVSLAEKSQFAIDELGILFSQEVLSLSTKRNISFDWLRRNEFKNYVGSKNYKYLTNKDGWMEITGAYTADGTEKYLVLGNFKSNSETRRTKVASNLKRAAYYYIDMVSVEEIKEPFQLDETYVLNNLTFNLNGYEISNESKQQLSKLVAHLKENPALNVSIYGHTDSIGSKEYNKKLSQKRAEEVGQFLLDNGLSPSRIEWKGFGDMVPVAQNETAEGREKNRRVEFVISEENGESYASGMFEDDE